MQSPRGQCAAERASSGADDAAESYEAGGVVHCTAGSHTRWTDADSCSAAGTSRNVQPTGAEEACPPAADQAVRACRESYGGASAPSARAGAIRCCPQKQGATEAGGRLWRRLRMQIQSWALAVVPETSRQSRWAAEERAVNWADWPAAGRRAWAVGSAWRYRRCFCPV